MLASKKVTPFVRFRTSSFLFATVLLSALALGSLAVSGFAQEGKGQGAGLPDLVAGLKATPGCLGVETARTTSGKNVIFAWFESKKAVLNWYYSDMHQGVIKTFFPGHKPGEPLKDVPDDVGPIMAIASLTMTDKSKSEGTTLPISQISIELYKPITGGIFLGGRFAPNGLKVPNMKDYTPTSKQ